MRLDPQPNPADVVRVCPLCPDAKAIGERAIRAGFWVTAFFCEKHRPRPRPDQVDRLKQTTFWFKFPPLCS